MQSLKKREAKNQAKELVQDRERRTNLKSKRKRNMIKKAIELSHMCNMDILILIRDREMDKMFQYSSGKAEATDFFTVERAISHYERLRHLNGKLKMFKDSDYEELKILYNRNGSTSVGKSTQHGGGGCKDDEDIISESQIFNPNAAPIND